MMHALAMSSNNLPSGCPCCRAFRSSSGPPAASRRSLRRVHPFHFPIHAPLAVPPDQFEHSFKACCNNGEKSSIDGVHGGIVCSTESLCVCLSGKGGDLLVACMCTRLCRAERHLLCTAALHPSAVMAATNASMPPDCPITSCISSFTSVESLLPCCTVMTRRDMAC
jgi:hypothetical protein